MPKHLEVNKQLLPQCAYTQEVCVLPSMEEYENKQYCRQDRISFERDDTLYFESIYVIAKILQQQHCEP